MDQTVKFFPHGCLLPDMINWCEQINKKETFFVAKISFEGMSVCRKFKHYPQVSFFMPNNCTY